MSKRFLITAALPYSNGRLHVGHIGGAYLPADTYVRFLRAKGVDVRFVCGSDDNGVASLISAEKEGRSVAELTADYSARQARDFEWLGIDFDIFGGTHQPDYVERHTEISQAFFRRIHEAGYFVKRTSRQLYDEKVGRFLPDRYVKGTCYNCGHTEAYGDQCESCGISIDPLKLIEPVSTLSDTTPVPRDTTHWYIQLQRLEEALREWLESKRETTADSPAWRDSVLNFTLGQIKQGLPERAMTRDLDWGVPVPLDDPDAEGKVLYVWFDAPIGYVSFTSVLGERRGESAEDWTRWWKDPDSRIVHFIGEDNVVFHALIWPAMLMAEGSFELPWQVVANSFINIKFPDREEEKISKSRGTAIWIEDCAKQFDPDPLRYYLTAIAPETARTAFDPEDFVQRNNGELLATLGNFIHRSLTFGRRTFDGALPEAADLDDLDRQQLDALAEAHRATTANLEAFRFKAALGEVMGLARAANVYLDRKAPWKLKKTDMVACGTSIHVCVQTVRTLAVLMAPFLPASAEKLRVMLGLPEEALRWDAATERLPAGHPLAEPEVLFRKIEADEVFGTEA